MSTQHGGLIVRDLAFGYHGSEDLFNDWSHAFPRGQLTAVLGASGRGKSTLLYLLGLMLLPRSGEIIIDDTSTTGLTDAELADLRAWKLGFVFQDAALDASRSILDNVLESCLYRRQSPSAWRDRALQALADVGVDLDPNRKPGKISGGQAQRIALCRALLHNPQVVLADEPTGNLDEQTADLVMRRLRNSASAGATVIVVTHDPRVAAECPHQVRL